MKAISNLILLTSHWRACLRSALRLPQLPRHGAPGVVTAILPTGTRQLYYRLWQVDSDGAAHYSPVRSVAPAGGPLALFPNPAAGLATLTGATPGAVVQVLDALGRPVLTSSANAGGMASLALPAALPGGVYVVRTDAQAARLVAN